MKRFRTTSIIFITVITAFFSANVYYLITLYQSIKSSVEQDVMNALLDANIDELWLRTEMSDVESKAQIEPNENPQTGELSAAHVKQGTDSLMATTRYADGTEKSAKLEIDTCETMTNNFVKAIGAQLHGVIDPLIGINADVLDSVFMAKLNDRGIYPATARVEIVDASGKAVARDSSNMNSEGLDSFTLSINPDMGLYYRGLVTPLTRQVLSRMEGVIITLLLMMVTFGLAFRYLYRTVSKLKTLEEMKDDFVNNMTHELKTPIAIAYSANDALLHFDVNDEVKKTTYLNIANKQLKRLGELVENILAMSMERRKTLKLKMEDINLPALVDEVASVQRMRPEKPINITTLSDPDIHVNADRTHLTNVLYNLVDNAIKYSGRSVDITIRCDNNQITVTDNGIGIPEKAIPYLFNRFYRVHHGNIHEVRGYGIGLYYVRNILRQMNATISVRSRENEGSEFTIKFNADET